MKDILEASGTILGYGLTGLCLLLMILTYMTLNKVISTRNVSSRVISLVKFYFVLTIATLVIVGGFTLLLGPQNTRLKTEVNHKNEQISHTTDTLKALQLTVQINMAINEGIKTNTKEITQQADTLAKYVRRITPISQQQTVLSSLDSLRANVTTMPVGKPSDSIQLNTAVKRTLLRIQKRLIVQPN